MKFFQKNIGTHNATLSAYIQSYSNEMPNLSQRPAVLIFPGGAYRNCSDREAEPVALAYIQKGFNAFVLRYTTSNQCPVEDVFKHAFAEAEEALEYIRNNATELQVEENHIAVVGFSAGGNLASALGTIGRIKPDALILGYAAVDENINRNLGIEAPIMLNQITSNTPPTFLFATQADSVVPSSETLKFALALAEEKVPYECHVFVTGDHGLSLANETVCSKNGPINNDVAQWHSMSVRFLENLWNGQPLIIGSSANTLIYSIDSRLDTLFTNERATFILEKHLPDVCTKLKGNPMASGMTLRKLATYTQGAIPLELLEQIDIALQAL